MITFVRKIKGLFPVKKKVLEKLQVYQEDIMQWTEIKDGKELKNAMMHL